MGLQIVREALENIHVSQEVGTGGLMATTGCFGDWGAD